MERGGCLWQPRSLHRLWSLFPMGTHPHNGSGISRAVLERGKKLREKSLEEGSWWDSGWLSQSRAGRDRDPLPQQVTVNPQLQNCGFCWLQGQPRAKRKELTKAEKPGCVWHSTGRLFPINPALQPHLWALGAQQGEAGTGWVLSSVKPSVFSSPEQPQNVGGLKDTSFGVTQLGCPHSHKFQSAHPLYYWKWRHWMSRHFKTKPESLNHESLVKSRLEPQHPDQKTLTIASDPLLNRKKRIIIKKSWYLSTEKLCFVWLKFPFCLPARAWNNGNQERLCPEQRPQTKLRCGNISTTLDGLKQLLLWDAELQLSQSATSVPPSTGTDLIQTENATKASELMTRSLWKVSTQIAQVESSCWTSLAKDLWPALCSSDKEMFECHSSMCPAKTLCFSWQEGMELAQGAPGDIQHLQSWIKTSKAPPSTQTATEGEGSEQQAPKTSFRQVTDKYNLYFKNKRLSVT